MCKECKVITEEEKNEIINKAVEKTLLSLPEVIGNLITNHVTLHKINSEFYKEHPEFTGKKDVVQSVVEMIEGENPLLDYKEILDKAVPEIKKRIVIMQDVDMTNIPKVVKRDFSNVDFSGNGNGVL
jgi:hypothetical protein